MLMHVISEQYESHWQLFSENKRFGDMLWCIINVGQKMYMGIDNYSTDATDTEGSIVGTDDEHSVLEYNVNI